MKVKKQVMPLLQKIFYILSFLFLIGSFMYLGTKDFNAPKKSLTDAESFQNEYGISVENIYQYKSSKEVLETLTNGSAIFFLGYPENPWSSSIAELLNTAGKKAKLDTIYYYNFKKDRSNNNHNYEEIVELLESYLPHVDTESLNLYAPTILAVKNGKITYYDDETSIVRGDTDINTYWTKEKKLEKELEYLTMIHDFLEEKDETKE